jgi:hypothetical protein
MTAAMPLHYPDIYIFRKFAGLALTCMMSTAAFSQVFTGVNTNGSVVLSSFADDAAPTLLLPGVCAL